MLMRRSLFGILSILTPLLAAAPAHALDSGWKKADHVSLRIVSAVESVGEDETIDAVLQMQLDDGWHAYWRTPGDAGQKPDFDWKESAKQADLTATSRSETK